MASIKYEEWQRARLASQSSAGWRSEAQAAVLDCSDTLERVLGPASSNVCLAAPLFVVNKAWRAALQSLPIFCFMQWELVTRSARRCDSAVPALCLSILKWWGSRLKEFDAGSGCPVARELLTNSILSLVASCSPQLQVVRLYGCMHITDAGLKQLAAAAPPLHTFSLEWCGSGVFQEGLRAVVRACPLLETFSVSGDQESASLASVNDELALDLVAHCPRITSLELSDTRVGDRGLAAIASSYGPRLGSLQLNYTRDWTQWGIQAVAQRCTQLQFFSAVGSGLTDDGLSMLGAGCPQLAFVCVDRCKQVTLDGIMRLVNCSTSIQYVEMTGVFRQSSLDQQAAFGRWLQGRGLRYDSRTGLLMTQ